MLTSTTGTYVRHLAINQIIDIFVENTKSCQIISLGAGSDTRVFHLIDKYGDKILYHEIDFELTAKNKAKTILNTPKLSRLVPDATESSPNELHSSQYHLHARDLRTIKSDTELLEGMVTTLPTLVISECCLCYLQPSESDEIFAWMVKHFSNSGFNFALYEPLGGNDSFGEVMIQNLAMQGLNLPTLKKYPTLQSQVQRLENRGLGSVQATDMFYIYENWINAKELERISKLEFLDEIEELKLLLSHYCVAWSTINISSELEVLLKDLPHQNSS